MDIFLLIALQDRPQIRLTPCTLAVIFFLQFDRYTQEYFSTSLKSALGQNLMLFSKFLKEQEAL